MNVPKLNLAKIPEFRNSVVYLWNSLYTKGGQNKFQGRNGQWHPKGKNRKKVLPPPSLEKLLMNSIKFMGGHK